MISKIFKQINDLYHTDLPKLKNPFRTKNGLLWDTYINRLYLSKVMLLGAVDTKAGNLVGYCNPKGFWYLYDEELCLCQWNTALNLDELKLPFEVMMAVSSTDGIKLTKLRNDVEKVISLVEMTNMYKVRLIS